MIDKIDNFRANTEKQCDTKINFDNENEQTKTINKKTMRLGGAK